MSDTVCADCGKPFDSERPAGYVNVQASLRYHAGCGDPFGQKARDAELTKVIAQRDKLLEVVRPFAEHAQFFESHDVDEHFDCHPKDENFAYVDSELTVGDLRKARDIRNEITEGK